jgi:hypothetical protein
LPAGVDYDRRMSTKLVLVVWLSWLVAARANAQNATPIEDPLSSPRFATLDRADGTSGGALDWTYMFVKNNNGGTAFGVDAYGDYVDKATGLGGYVLLPIFYANGNNMTNGGIGDIELGALYVARLNPNAGIALRAGVALPSGATGENGLVNALESFARPTDFYLGIPKGTSMRLAASPLIRSGILFARLDVGVDVNFDQDGGGSVPTILRVNFGVGALLVPQLAVTLESSNMFVTKQPAGAQTNFDVAALSVRYAAGTIHPYAAVSIPLDSQTKMVFDAFLSLGLNVAMR